MVQNSAHYLHGSCYRRICLPFLGNDVRIGTLCHLGQEEVALAERSHQEGCFGLKGNVLHARREHTHHHGLYCLMTQILHCILLVLGPQGLVFLHQGHDGHGLLGILVGNNNWLFIVVHTIVDTLGGVLGQGDG